MTRSRSLAPFSVSLAVVAGAALLGACASSALGPGNAVPRPAGYRDWHHVKSMVIEAGHPLHDAFGGIHHVYANEAAFEGLRTGRYADGAVFAFDLLDVEKGGGAITEGKRKVLGVMHHDATVFHATGGWGFAGFDGAGQDVVKDMRNQCFTCHQAQEKQGYVFSAWRP